MAIDSEAKRKSIAAIGAPYVGPVVVPDSSFSQGDRQAIAYSYFGINAGGGPSLVVTPYYYLHLMAGN